jgi:hypothetical protein
MTFLLPAKRQKVRSGIARAPQREWPRHRRFVRSHECILAGRPNHACEGPVVCCHLRLGTDGAGALKPSDWWAWAGCDGAHRLQHQIGEIAFAALYKLDLKAVCLAFARASTDVEMKAVMKELGLL